MFNQVKWLTKTRKAKNFFIVDDRLEEDKAETLIFFNKIAKHYGRALDFTVQSRKEGGRLSMTGTILWNGSQNSRGVEEESE